ncbi:MAG: T9SS type A sorting domain-containing protein [Bacteroidales bacterium]|jgi:hypothetical protein|nr:T9SS type A sorting domain-containing protein [Bacteroidales bacterium]
MKRTISLLFVAALISTVLFSQGQARYAVTKDGDCESFPQVIDSFYVYNMNRVTGQWELATISQYENTGLRHDRLLMINMPGRVVNRVWEYYYDDNGNRYYELSKIWRQGEWYLHMKRDSEFDQDKQKLSQLTSNWRNGTWVFNSYFYNLYDAGNLTRVVYQGMDTGGILYDISYSDYYYDNGLLSGVHGHRSSDGTVTGITTYRYGMGGRIEEMLQLIPSESDPGEMINSKKRLYFYDDYSLLREVLFYDWESDRWEITIRFEYFYKIDHARKVTVCHNGNTICISVNALPAHLSIGSTLGPCTDEKKKDEGRGAAPSIKTPFTVYPNPATDKISVRLESQSEHRSGVIQLSDFHGRLLRSVNIEGQNEVTLYREGLKDGKYIVRLVGDQTWQTVVIFN